MGEGRDDPQLRRWELEMKQSVKRVAVSKGEFHSRIPRAPRKAEATQKQSPSAGWIGQVRSEKDGAEMVNIP